MGPPPPRAEIVCLASSKTHAGLRCQYQPLGSDFSCLAAQIRCSARHPRFELMLTRNAHLAAIIIILGFELRGETEHMFFHLWLRFYLLLRPLFLRRKCCHLSGFKTGFRDPKGSGKLVNKKVKNRNWTLIVMLSQ